MCWVCIKIRKLNKICYLMLFSYLMCVYANVTEKKSLRVIVIEFQRLSENLLCTFPFIYLPILLFSCWSFCSRFFWSEWNKIYVLPLNCVCEIEMILMERQLNIQWMNESLSRISNVRMDFAWKLNENWWNYTKIWRL